MFSGRNIVICSAETRHRAQNGVVHAEPNIPKLILKLQFHLSHKWNLKAIDQKLPHQYWLHNLPDEKPLPSP